MNKTKSYSLVCWIVFLFAPFSSNAGSWSTAPPMPAPAQEIYPVIVGQHIAVAGGFGVNGVTDQTMIYQIEQQTWRDGPKLPVPRHHIYLAERGGQVLAIGGYEVIGKAVWNMRANV